VLKGSIAKQKECTACEAKIVSIQNIRGVEKRFKIRIPVAVAANSNGEHICSRSFQRFNMKRINKRYKIEPVATLFCDVRELPKLSTACTVNNAA
jgi:hypothetical protein